MFVATLITARKGPGLDDTLVGDASSLVAARRTHWLEPGIALDIFFDAPLTEAASMRLRELLVRYRTDGVVQQAATRRKKILIADMDSTMIGEECIDELADVVGLKEAVAGITARAMNGEIAFEPALVERVALLEGLQESVISQVIKERITYAPGGAALVATMRANGGYTALVSGGFTAFTGTVAARLGFDENRANRLDILDGRLAGTVAHPILGREAKVEALRDIAATRGLTPEDAIAVGDGANDLGMIAIAGTGVAIHAKPAVAAEAPHRIDHGDLTALLFLQGYSAERFVTA